MGMSEKIRMTKKLLKNYIKYKREIPFLENEIKEMLTSDAGLGNSVIIDYRKGYPRPQNVVGFDWNLYDHRCDVLERRKQQINLVDKWIAEISDGQTRVIMRMRYCEGMPWVKIADKTGYGGRTDYIRLHIRDAYLKKCGIK